MSDKYTIKNCELICNGECPNSKTGYCQDCTDCVLKQIVGLCKEDLKPVREWQEGDTVFVEYKKDVYLARDILRLLDIQECE